jgi:hypothetical protein
MFEADPIVWRTVGHMVKNSSVVCFFVLLIFTGFLDQLPDDNKRWFEDRHNSSIAKL